MGSLCSMGSSWLNRYTSKQKAFRGYPEGFLFSPAYLSTCLLIYQELIKPNRLIDRSSVFIYSPTHIENVLPTLLGKPGGDLRATSAVMAHDIDCRIHRLCGFGQSLRACACQLAHRRDLQPAIRELGIIQFIKLAHIEQDEFIVGA